MMKMAMSPAAAALLRSLLGRAGVERDRILLTEFRSTDWQSLTFVGERHEIRFRIPGPDSKVTAARLLDGLEDAELEVWGHFVADITLADGPFNREDGSIELGIEALTVADS
jgi:hypothetical protein